MKLRITVIDAGRGHRSSDVHVEALPGSTSAELAAALSGPATSESGPDQPAPCLFVNGHRLAPDHRVGSPPLLDGALVIIGGPGADRARLAPGVLELHVVSGPDAGNIFRLPPGEHRVGRAAEANVRLEDPDVSRLHAVIDVQSTHVVVTDLDSTNGCSVDGVRVVGTAVMSTSNVLRVGHSTLRLCVPVGSPASTRADGVGHLLVNRRPRVAPRAQPLTVTFPEPPATPARSRLPLLALLVPLALSGTLAAVMRSPTMLLFGLMSPVLLLATWLSERRGGSGRRRKVEVEHADAISRARAQLDLAIESERRECEQRDPDLATVLGIVEGIESRLWQRRPGDPDSLVVRLGTATLPSTTRVEGGDAPNHQLKLDRVPFALDLRELGVVGVAGARSRVLGVARALLGQLAAWHSPLDVRIVLLLDGRADVVDWQWAALLPHTGAANGTSARWMASLQGHEPGRDSPVTTTVSAIAKLVQEREQARGAATQGGHRPDVVVVLDGSARLRAVALLSQVLERGPSVGVHVLALDDDRERLPVEARCVVTVDGHAGAVVLLAGHAGPVDVVPDEPGARWGVRLARAMAPLRDATPDATTRAIPASVRLLDLLDANDLEASTLSTRWLAQPRSTRVLIGVGADGPVSLDLRRDGPHALVAGTTGAGKSELLQSLIASLALANRPDELVFVLVDYKGGSAFRECAQLPHTVGVVTDLDGHLTQRALTSLGAELHRRERLLAEAGATDLEDYQARRSGGSIPRLILVIDEFRLLAEELPDFVHGLVRIAAVGRSLGLHLVLATQRPGGIVSADIRANVGLRIALRVRDRLDSTDVVESPDAAGILEGTPGRAFVRSAATPLTEFQTARIAGVWSPRSRVLVHPLPSAQLPRPPVPEPENTRGVVTDLRRVVEVTRSAARLHGIPPVPPPWLPPLPDLVPHASLAPGRALSFGLRDDPLGQCQEAFGWDLTDGSHLGFAGGPRSGRTTALRTLAGTLAASFGPHELHLYAVHAGGLSALSSLPHTAALASRTNIDHVEDVVKTLAERVSSRQETLARRGLASVAEQHHDCEAAGGVPMPYLVLLVDGWEPLVEALAVVNYGRPVQELLQLIRDGSAAGLRVVVTGERALLAGQLSGILTTRLILRVSDPMELALAGIPLKSVPHRQPPGRALHARDHREIQIAVLGDDPTSGGQVEALEQIGRDARSRWHSVDARSLPTPVRQLPRQVSLADVEGDPRWRFDGNHAGIGVGAGDLRPVGFDVAAGQRRILVIGPPRSGRSTALVVLARSLASGGRPVAVIGGWRVLPSVAPGSSGFLRAVGAGEVEDLVSLRRRHPELALVVDDAERLVGTALEAVVREISRLVDEDDGVVVAATSPTAMAAQPRGWHSELARARTGVLLCPTPAEGDLLGVRLTRPGERLPGRGILVVGGDSRSIQVAQP